MKKIMFIIIIFLIGCADADEFNALKNVVYKQQEELKILNTNIENLSKDITEANIKAEEKTGKYTLFSGGTIGGYEFDSYAMEGNCICFEDLNNRKKYKVCGQFVLKYN